MGRPSLGQSASARRFKLCRPVCAPKELGASPRLHAGVGSYMFQHRCAPANGAQIGKVREQGKCFPTSFALRAWVGIVPPVTWTGPTLRVSGFEKSTSSARRRGIDTRCSIGTAIGCSPCRITVSKGGALGWGQVLSPS